MKKLVLILGTLLLATACASGERLPSQESSSDQEPSVLEHQQAYTTNQSHQIR